MVYYLQQHSTLLSQISVQLASITTQVSIPSTPPAPFPAFTPSPSDIIVNAFWFMALAFSLLAALLAILVQKWVRDYMHVYDQYNDPLKTSRLRQYLYEGCEKWYMPIVAEAVPGCLHVSLFLFFVGLGDSLFNIHTVVATTTIIPISIGGLLYILTTFLPIISPQSPYQNTFSGIFWFLFQKLRIRKYKDDGRNGGLKPLHTTLAKGRAQLAMEREAREGRDVQAIRWLINNLTEDAEMERFLSAIPGSFDTQWGIEVWKKVGGQDERKKVGPYFWNMFHGVFRSIAHLAKKLTSHHSPSSETTDPFVMRKFSERIQRSLAIYKIREPFEDEELWRKRMRPCIETTALLVHYANAEIAWFGDIVELLGKIGHKENARESSLAGRDQLFVMRWTCLSLVAIRRNLEDKKFGQHHTNATSALDSFSRQDDTGDRDREALAGARKIDGNIREARRCLNRICDALVDKEKDQTEEEVLSGREFEILKLEQLNIEAENIQGIDRWILKTQDSIAELFHRITYQIPGVVDDLGSAPVPFSRVLELRRDPLKRQFIRPGRTLESMCSSAPTLRKTLEGQANADEYKELLQDLKKFRSLPRWEGNEMQREVWRLQDLHDGGGFGFTVELFFLASDQLWSTSSSKEDHSEVYLSTFKAITSGWSKHKNLPGTRNLLLDIVQSRHWQFGGDYFPPYIVDEFFLLLRNIFEGQPDSRINEARQQVESFDWGSYLDSRNRVLEAITGEQAGPL
jgi:uncharacterized protein DUF6535